MEENPEVMTFEEWEARNSAKWNEQIRAKDKWINDLLIQIEESDNKLREAGLIE